MCGHVGVIFSKHRPGGADDGPERPDAAGHHEPHDRLGSWLVLWLQPSGVTHTAIRVQSGDGSDQS